MTKKQVQVSDQASIVDETNAVNQRLVVTPQDVDSPTSEFIKSVQFVELPSTAGKASSPVIAVDSITSSSSQSYADTPGRREAVSHDVSGKSGKDVHELKSLWDPLDTDDLLLAAEMVEEEEIADVSTHKKSIAIDDSQAGGGYVIAAAGVSQDSTEIPASSVAESSLSNAGEAETEVHVNVNYQQKSNDAGTTVSSIVSVGKRYFRAILSPTEGKNELSRESKMKKK